MYTNPVKNYPRSEQLKKMLDFSSEMICLLDDEGFIKIASAASLTILGYHSAEIIGKSISDFIHDIEQKKILVTLKRLKIEKSPVTFFAKFYKKNGALAHLECTANWVAEDNAYYATARDVTERKANEKMLQRPNVSLERRAKELTTSNEELERFAYVASHDLQEPLRMVTSFLQLLEKKYKDKLDTKATEYIAYAVDGAERMKKLILDLLQYSRVNSSKIEKEEVSMENVVKDLQLTYKRLLDETGGVIKTGELPVVKANKTQMMQLFQNLVSNALKYRNDSPPVIEISSRDVGKFYEFSVADNGIGIASRFFEKIFIIFQRLHHRDKYKGTGIGLAICKKIVEKHGGKIWINSAEGEGSTFYFTLPNSK